MSDIESLHGAFLQQTENSSFRDTLVKFLSVNDLPFTLTDLPYFKEVLDSFNKEYKSRGNVDIPNGETILNDLQSSYVDLERKVGNILSSEIHSFSACFDIIRFLQSNYWFMGISISWINQQFIHRKLLLDLVHLTDSYTAEDLSTHFIKLMNRYQLLDRLVSATAGNKSIPIVKEVMKSIDFGNNQTIPIRYYGNESLILCSSDILNLVLKEFLDHKNIKDQIQSYIKYVKDKRKSGSQLVKEIVDKIPPISFNYQWTSVYIMLSCINDHYQTLNSYKALPTSQMVLQQILGILKPFYLSSMEFSNDSITLSECSLIFRYLFKFMETECSKLNIESYLFEPIQLSIWKLMEYKDTNLLNISTILDPRLKMDVFTIENGFNQETIDEIHKDFNRLYQTYYDKVENGYQNKSTSQPSFIDEILRKRRSSIEISSYLKSSVPSDIDSILGYWQINQNRYPILSMMAKDIFSIESTTGFLASKFTIAPDMVINYNASLDPDTIRMLTLQREFIIFNDKINKK